MNHLGILFAGQGAQSPSMGQSFLKHPVFLASLSSMQRLLGYDVMQLIASNDGRLNQTLYTQPSIFVISSLLWKVINETLHPRVEGTVGFSLGEYAALGASEIFSFESLLRLIQVRATAMHEASTQNPGKMAAILGLETSVVQDLCQQASQGDEIVTLANLNCPGQVVISGHGPAVERAVPLATAKGARRAVMLNVSGSFHSPLMMSAQQKLNEALTKEPLQTLKTKIYLNVDALPADLNHVKKKMVEQLVSPVRFELSIRHMIRDGFTHFLEIGPGTVLQGLVKKIAPEIPVISFNELSEFESVKGWLLQYGFIQ